MPETDSSRDATLRELLAGTRRIAVLGASARPGRASFDVPAYLLRQGYTLVPVNPHRAGGELHGSTVVASLAEIDGAVDIVDVFRRSEDVPGHLEDILAMRPLPRAVWLQLGIRNDDAARTLRAEGIEVVQDLCLKVEHRRLLGEGAAEGTA